MTILVFFIFTMYFLFCQYLIEKNKLPKKLFSMNLLQLILLGIFIIALSIVFGLMLHIEWLLIPAVTLFCASVLGAKFRKSFI